MCKKMGRPCKVKARHNKHWTEEEDEILIEHWGEFDINYFVRKLNRTKAAIIKRGKVLKLGSPLFQNYFTKNYVAKQLGRDRRTLDSLGIEFFTRTFNNKGHSLITLEDLMYWLKNNPDKYYARNIKEFAFGIEPEFLVEKRRTEATYRFHRKYSKTEDTNIISMFKMDIPIEQIAIELNRPVAGIRSRLYKLGLLKPKCKCVPWSDDEDKRLDYLIFHTDYSLDDIADDIMRSKIAIKTRIQRKHSKGLRALRKNDKSKADNSELDNISFF